jgi:hypothetical protein
MDKASLRVCKCVKALRGTGVGLLVVLLPVVLLPALELLLPALVAVLRELEPEELAVCEAAEPPAAADNTVERPALVEADERAEVELMLDDEVVLDDELVLLARFNTEGVALSVEPLLLELGVSNELAVDAADAAPAPDEEPPVPDCTAATVPVWEDWMYRSCRLPGLR